MPVCVAFVIDPAQTVLDGIGFKDGMREAEGDASQKIADGGKQTIDAEARDKSKS